MCTFEAALRAEFAALRETPVQKALAAVHHAVDETKAAYPLSSIGWQVQRQTLEIHAIYWRDKRDHLRVSLNPRRNKTEAVIEQGNYSRPTLLAAYNAAIKALQGLGEDGWAELGRAVAEARQPGVKFAEEANY